MLNLYAWRRRMMQALGAGGASARAAGRLGRVERRREVHPGIVCDSCQVAPRPSRALYAASSVPRFTQP